MTMIERNLKNVNEPKNEDNLKNEADIKKMEITLYIDDLKNEDN